MTNRGDTAATYATLAELRDRLGQLHDALEPGTPHRWGQRDLTDAETAARDAEALQERAERLRNSRMGLMALSGGRPPLNVSVLDSLVHVETGVLAIERRACEWLGLTPLAGVDPAERITRVIGLLDRIRDLDQLAAWVDTETTHLARVARRAVGDTEPVHKLDARCPICSALSLRAFPERELVVCCNENCACTDEGCSCSSERPRRHRWRFGETGLWGWTRLAEVIDEELKTAS